MNILIIIFIKIIIIKFYFLFYPNLFHILVNLIVQKIIIFLIIDIRALIVYYDSKAIIFECE